MGIVVSAEPQEGRGIAIGDGHRLAFHESVWLRDADERLSEIRNPYEATRALHDHWPETRGKWYYAASRACSAAIEGRTSVHVARRIFVQAVEESRISA